MRLPRLRKRKDRLHEIGEAEAYHNSYGDRTADIKTSKLEPRRPRYDLKVSGEALRSRCQERLDKREEEEGKGK